ncbi:MAG TPA: N-acetyltransferase [Verrucomicrobiota bacterium]|nr:N-acetyltransferase [Verrucomicrobiota bacterium]HRZ36671.1 N-acetyltransferase [Candidatus Paceibacterota bacterium]HRZ54718.1 N-acetyltransferase [Candidatus Paceibacterota bacterium]
MSLAIVSLERRSRDLDRFLRVSYGIYNGDPHWVPPLLFDLKKVFTDANPLFEHAEAQLWVAERGGRDVGRIAGIIDHHFNRVETARTVFFGFFESADDPAVAAGLLDAVGAWGRSKGLTRLLGPMNPTSNDECGLLVEGFDMDPVFMMPYNPRYYPELLGGLGFQKAKDLLAYFIDISKSPLDRLNRLANKCRERNPELAFRAVTRKGLEADLGKVKQIYNAAWEHNWGFTPMTDAEVDFLAARLKPLLVEGLVQLVESPTEPVGFLLAVPDFNEALKPLEGRLLTPKLFGFIPYLFGQKVPEQCRVITLGVKEAYRGRGLESVMLSEGLKTGFRLGFTSAEASWVLEDNVKMRRVIELFGAKVYKRYRLYERAA